MTITLTSKEFDEAVSLWLQDQGFSTNTHSISTRVIAGRSDGPLGTRVEITLEPKPESHYETVAKVANLLEELVPDTFPTVRKFGQGHSDD